MKRVTIVTDLMFAARDSFYNDKDEVFNLITYIILEKEDRNKVHSDDYRKEIADKAEIELIDSKDGSKLAYSAPYDMTAKAVID